MKISYNWLKKYIDLQDTPEATGAMLTGCGLEVEGMEERQSVKGGLKGLVIGEVLEKTKHPNADKLSITAVSIGDGNKYQIVCGASNVEAGQKVVVATIGATLYPMAGEPFEIKKSKIRGEWSEGMICAEDEIGLGSSHDGIMVLEPGAKTGTPAAAYFKVETDYVFEIGLTPNRADAISHMGVARDLTAVINCNRLLGHDKENLLRVIRPEVSDFKPSIANPVSIHVEDTLACPRYTGVYIANISVAASPAWLQEKLLAAGLKPINNVVDITNFVMLETGQPLHAFDAEKISGKEVIVRQLQPGTVFTTLDGTERKLTGRELMICDNRGGLCIAGVYGGLQSGISDQTTNIFLEGAFFNATSIRKTAKQHNLKTDASFRFERGADPGMVIYAQQRAVLLMKELMPGISYSEITDNYPAPEPPVEVTLDLRKLEALCGVQIDREVVKQILVSLEMKVTGDGGHELSMQVPAFKPDVKRPVDVMEEVLRIYGYNRVPLPAKMSSSLPQFPVPDSHTIRVNISRYLAAQGFYELMGNSLTRQDYESLGGSPGKAVAILNPLSSDLGILRQSLVYSALETVSYNRNRKNPDIRCFEFGKIYFAQDGKYQEENRLNVLMAGKRASPHWIPGDELYSVFYLKSLLRNLLVAGGVHQDVDFREVQNPHYAVCITCTIKNQPVAFCGQLGNKLLSGFDLDGDIFNVDIDFDKVIRLSGGQMQEMKEAPKYPEVKRDLSMVLDKNVSYESVRKTAMDTEKKLLKRIRLFDVYSGDKMEAGKKSYAVTFYLSDDLKTLEDKQIEGIMERLMKNLEEKLGAVIRKA